MSNLRGLKNNAELNYWQQEQYKPGKKIVWDPYIMGKGEI